MALRVQRGDDKFSSHEDLSHLCGRPVWEETTRGAYNINNKPARACPYAHTESSDWHQPSTSQHEHHEIELPQAAFVPFSPPRPVTPINTSFFAIIRLKKQQRPARANK